MKGLKNQEKKQKYKMDISKRKTVFADLRQWCHMAGDEAYIEITEWTNGEGVDVDIHSWETQRFQLTWGAIDAIKELISKLETYE